MPAAFRQDSGRCEGHHLLPASWPFLGVKSKGSLGEEDSLSGRGHGSMVAEFLLGMQTVPVPSLLLKKDQDIWGDVEEPFWPKILESHSRPVDKAGPESAACAPKHLGASGVPVTAGAVLGGSQ